jgi:hypothetical protein
MREVTGPTHKNAKAAFPRALFFGAKPKTVQADGKGLARYGAILGHTPRSRPADLRE